VLVPGLLFGGVMYTFSCFEHLFDRKAKLITRSWDDWCGVFLHHDVRGIPTDTHNKKLLERTENGPCIILGEANGSLRGRIVRSIHALALNLAGDEILPALDILAPFEWALYSTHMSGAACIDHQTRLKVILPLRSPFSPRDYPLAWGWLSNFTGGKKDLLTRKVSCRHFLPSTFDSSLIISYRNRGKLYWPGDERKTHA
jgi:hypothetical protein